MIERMKFYPDKHPTKGTPPNGTVEFCKGVSEFEEQATDGTYDYNGHTEMWWDEQKTVIKRGPENTTLVKLVDEDGDEWWARVEHITVKKEES